MSCQTPKGNIFSRMPKTKEQHEIEFSNSVVRLQKMMNQISFPMRFDSDNPSLYTLNKKRNRKQINVNSDTLTSLEQQQQIQEATDDPNLLNCPQYLVNKHMPFNTILEDNKEYEQSSVSPSTYVSKI